MSSEDEHNFHPSLISIPSKASAVNQPGADKQGPDDDIQEDASIEEARQRQRMRWWFFGVGTMLSVLWMIAVIALSWHVFDVTRDLLSLLISAASAPALEFMRRFANYLLVPPLSDKEFELEKARIIARASKPSTMSGLIETAQGRKS